MSDHFALLLPIENGGGNVGRQIGKAQQPAEILLRYTKAVGCGINRRQPLSALRSHRQRQRTLEGVVGEKKATPAYTRSPICGASTLPSC